MATDDQAGDAKPTADPTEKKIEEESQMLNVSTRGWLAILLAVTVCAMSLLHITVSEPLYTLATVAITFYFSQAKKQQ